MLNNIEHRASWQAAESHTISPGDQIDHYHIDALVVRTALASIFRATDLNAGRKVAIKVPHDGIEDHLNTLERLRHEEQIGRRLSHPRVVRVLRDECGCRSRLYLVTEWIEGYPLRQILTQEGRLNPFRATRIAANVCEALSYIHNRGIVHRDVKPENILVDSADQITSVVT
jgi:serine/threonine protein kinase